MVVGTPRYMAPEQVTGEGLDARSDLFAVGAILFEMLAGRPAFGGRNAVEILHATLYEQPPALTGSPAVAAADRVIRRALAKRPSERPASADAMAEELRAVRGMDGDDTPALARTLTRLVVLPFRILRADPETDFLAFSLPDAIATSLSRIGSLVVRSSAIAARFAGEAPDLKALAAEADVDRVVMGTLVRSGDQLRAAAQLVEAPGGHAALVAHGPVVAGRPLPPAGRHRPARGGGARPAPRRPGLAHARAAAQRPRLFALPPCERARPQLRPAPPGARPVRAVPGAGSRLRSGLGPAGPLPPGDRQVHRRFGGHRGPRRGGLPPRPRAQPATLGGAQVLRAPRGGDGSAPGGARAPPGRGRRVTATTPSSSRGSSTRAVTAGSSSRRSRRTKRHGGSTRTCLRASSRRS